MSAQILQNYVDGRWVTPEATAGLQVRDPATAEVLAQVPLSSSADVDQAAKAAAAASAGWRRVPAAERIQYLFKLKGLLEEHLEELARTITRENGKILASARGELRRAIENVETACGIPSLMLGDFAEDIALGIDEYVIRQPVGVVATIAPFNFPAMIPFWYLPYALACGNTVLIKPSERTPMTMQLAFRLLEQLGLPRGVVNLVNGGPDTVTAILDHPAIQAITFVGSTGVARQVYARAAAHGKRVQAQGGARNPLIVLPDADLELAARAATESAYGNAGQRCLAASTVITVDGGSDRLQDALVEGARKRVVGCGLDPGVEMGPVITPQSKARIEGLIQRGVEEGATLLLDGRRAVIPGYERGNFLRPTILDRVAPDSSIALTEVFGPVMSLMHVRAVEEAIALVNNGRYGNMACLFTGSGAAARRFRYEVQAGNIGVNVGVAAPMAFFPFSGWKESFFGDLHGQGKHAVEFFTQTKVVVERWPGGA